jgi:Holliday junction resolvase
MTNSSAKGTRRERQLVNELYDRGWAVVRIPSSGSATDRELPDVFAMRDHPDTPFESIALAIEVKANAGEYATLDTDEVHDLNAFSTRAGPTCLPVIATHPDHDHWHFFPTVELNERSQGYSVTKAMYPGRGLEELLGYGDPTDEDGEHRLANAKPAEQPAPAPFDGGDEGDDE